MRSTAAIARELGVTVQAVNKYRRRIEKQLGNKLGTVDPADARRTLFSEDEFQQIKALAPTLPREPIAEVEIIDGEDVEVIDGPTSALALRHNSFPAVQRRRFDIAAADADVRGINAHAYAAVGRMDELLSELAVGEVQAAVAEVQRTVATMKANALCDALAVVGKPAQESPKA